MKYYILCFLNILAGLGIGKLTGMEFNDKNLLALVGTSFMLWVLIALGEIKECVSRKK